MLNNPFNIHRAKVEVLKEDPAHYAAIARNNAAKQAERDKSDPEAAKKREKAKAAINKKFTKLKERIKRLTFSFPFGIILVLIIREVIHYV